MSAWLTAAWGKFRSHERGLEPRMTRAQLRGARTAYEALLELDGSRESLRAASKRIDEGLDGEELEGAVAFADWFGENRERLATPPSKTPVDMPHTTDDVGVQLL